MREVRSRQFELISIAALLLCTLAVYLPSVSFGFVADDTSQILANYHIHSPEYIPAYFTSHVWSQVAMSPGERPAPYYRPVFLLWLLGNYSLFGYATAGWHLSVVFLHVLVTLLVYFVARRVLSEWWMAAAAALLFGLHPVHIEAVDWVSGASEPIMAAPFLAAVLCYIQASRAPRSVLWMSAALASYAVAIFAKETAIVLPLILIAYDLLLRVPSGDNRKFPELAKRMLGFAAITAGYWAMRSYALRGVHVNPLAPSTFALTFPSAVWFYISHLLAPVRLSFFYNVAYVGSLSFSAVLFPLLAAGLVLAFVALWARYNRVAAFAAFWACISILPPLYLPAFLRYELVHDRYLYVPSVGFCILAAMALASIAQFVAGRRYAAALPAVSLALAGMLAFAYAVLTLRQAGYWSNEASLFTRSFQIGSANWSAERNYVYALSRSGQCGEALPLLQTFQQHDPEDAKASFALGSCYFHLGQLDDAELMMRRTAQLAPHYQQPYLVLAAIRLSQRRVDDAANEWRAAVRAQGPNEELSVHYVHGEILKAQGDFLDAADEFRKELQFQPGNPEILSELASIEGQTAITNQ